MKTEAQIHKLLKETDCEITERVLSWVLTSDNECPLCNRKDSMELEANIIRQTITPLHLDASMGWLSGTTQDHMDNHRHYDPVASQIIESARSGSISTLSVAEQLSQELLLWFNEMKERKNTEGLTDEVVMGAMKIANQLNQSVRLVGQLKKEIGVDSQLMLAQGRIDTIMGILVDVLSSEPRYLNEIESRLLIMKEPTKILDVNEDDWDYE